MGDELKFNPFKRFALAAHPVGSYYWSSEPTDPAKLFGGTWEQVKDRFVLAAGDSYTAGSTGGETTVTLTETQMPSHTHDFQYSTDDSKTWESLFIGEDGSWDGGAAYAGMQHRVAPGANYVSRNAFAGGGEAHNNMPPYIVAFCWRRTA